MHSFECVAIRFARAGLCAFWQLPAALLAALVVASPLCTGCRRTPDDAAPVLAALFDYRRASTDEASATAAQALAAAPCRDPLVCTVQRDCVAMTAAFVQAATIKRAVAGSLASGAPLTDQAKGPMLADLDRAKAQLELARAAAPKCESSEASLRQAYGL
jgi:hypothetical protein